MAEPNRFNLNSSLIQIIICILIYVLCIIYIQDGPFVWNEQLQGTLLSW